jgi:hypothetical protein
MDNKVLLFDSNNAKVGETFMRRAKQLVSSQRAEWTDENHTAIRFAPDAEDYSPSVICVPVPEPRAEAAGTIISKADDEAWIYAAAEQQIKERRNFILHSIAFIPGIFLLFVLHAAVIDQLIMGDVELLFFFFLGAWISPYCIHSWVFAKKRLKNIRLWNTEERNARRLNAEVERIRRGISG